MISFRLERVLRNAHERRCCSDIETDQKVNWMENQMPKTNFSSFIIGFPFFSHCLKLSNVAIPPLENQLMFMQEQKVVHEKFPSFVLFIWSFFLIFVVPLSSRNHNNNNNNMCITFGQFSRKVMNFVFVNHLSDVSGNLPYD